MKKKKASQEQLLLNFDQIENDTKNTGASDSQGTCKFNLRRALVAWTLRQKPSGIGVMVPTRFLKYQADVAAFWSAQGRNRTLVPVKTVIIECRDNRDDCWPDCSKRDEILSSLMAKKDEKRSYETEIRHSEPHLRDGDNLFNEFESWNYSASKNRNYAKCLKSIEGLEHAIYKGSRFERIMRANVANELYLAVPAGTVHADELADGWGLLFIHNDLSVEIAKPAELRDCPESRKMHLVQNIASSCLPSMIHSHGVRLDADEEVFFTRVPKVPRARKNDVSLNRR